MIYSKLKIKSNCKDSWIEKDKNYIYLVQGDEIENKKTKIERASDLEVLVKNWLLSVDRGYDNFKIEKTRDAIPVTVLYRNGRLYVSYLWHMEGGELEEWFSVQKKWTNSVQQNLSERGYNLDGWIMVYLGDSVSNWETRTRMVIAWWQGGWGIMSHSIIRIIEWEIFVENVERGDHKPREFSIL